MQRTHVWCDHCGSQKPPRPAEPPTWWSLEDYGRVRRTGPLAFCSLACVQAFVADPQVREIYAADFVAPAATPLPERFAGIRTWRRRVGRWLLQILIVRVA